MNLELAVIEAFLSIGFLLFGWQRWRMGFNAAAVMCLMLSIYFGRICLLYTGRAFGIAALENAIEPRAIFTNAALLLFALVMAVSEAHEIGYRRRRDQS